MEEVRSRLEGLIPREWAKFLRAPEPTEKPLHVTPNSERTTKNEPHRCLELGKIDKSI